MSTAQQRKSGKELNPHPIGEVEHRRSGKRGRHADADAPGGRLMGALPAAQPHARRQNKQAQDLEARGDRSSEGHAQQAGSHRDRRPYDLPSPATRLPLNTCTSSHPHSLAPPPHLALLPDAAALSDSPLHQSRHPKVPSQPCCRKTVTQTQSHPLAAP